MTGSEPLETADRDVVANDEKAAEDNDDPPPPAKLPSSKKTKKATTSPPKKDDEKKPPAVGEKSKVPKKTAAAAVDPTSAPPPERIADLEPPQPARPPATNQAAQRPSSSPTLFGNQFKEAIFQDKAGGANSDLGFFDGAQENFPGLEAFGLSWEPKKVATPSASSRSKRAATIVLKNPFYYRDDRRKRVSRQGARPLRQKPAGAAALGSRRSGQGPSGFWDNTEFDSDFFNGGSPGPATNSQTGFSSSYEDFSSPAPLPPVQKYVQQQQPAQYQKPARLTYSLPSQVRKLANIGK